MKRLLILLLFLCLVSCGKKEWPQPIAAEEMLYIDHIEARQEGNCILINAKLGGNLLNLEFFRIELEENGCPTCPFSPSSIQTIYPFEAGVFRKENSFLITICPDRKTQNLRLRLTADNTLRVMDPALSAIVPVNPAR